VREDLLDFDAAAAAVLDAYGRREYAECLHLALIARDRFPKHRARTTFWVACMRSMTGQPQAALDELTAGLDRGDWWSDHLLRTDPDLAAARKLPRFEGIARRSGIAFADRGKSDTRPSIVERPEGRPSSLLIALHGGAGTAEQTAPEWRSCVSAGSMLVVPESPYRATSDDDERGHDWLSIDASTSVVADALTTARLPSESELPAVVGGFSQGGRLAARLAITSTPVPWRGAILFGPSPMDAKGIETMPRDEQPSFWIFVGEDDLSCLEPAHRLSADLDAAGARVELETAPGVGHEYPADVGERLARALGYVLA